MGENLGPLSQAGADEEKAWESRGIQGKTGQRQGLIVGTLSRQLQVSDWREEEQNRCEWKSDRGREVGSRQRSFVVGAAHRATSTESACRCPSGAEAAQDSLAPSPAHTSLSHCPCDTYQIPVFMQSRCSNLFSTAIDLLSRFCTLPFV